MATHNFRADPQFYGKNADIALYRRPGMDRTTAIETITSDR